MRQVGRWLGKAIGAFLIALALLWVLGPREPVDTEIYFESSRLTGDLDAYLAAQEARFDDIIPGVENRIVWANAPGERTEFSVIYLHVLAGDILSPNQTDETVVLLRNWVETLP